MTNTRLLPFITGLFTATLLISNTLDTKFFTAFGLDMPAGIILFPLAYVFGDVLTEVYGYGTSRRVIWTGFAALLLMLLAYEIARVLPASAFWENQPAFETIFSHIPRIVVASIVAYFCGEFINSFIVAKLKVIQNGKGMAARFVASTVFGQFVDTTVFVAIAFLGTTPVASLVPVVLSAWAVKVGWEVIALPLTIVVVRAIKRAEQTDFYDRDTDFNPFSVK